MTRNSARDSRPGPPAVAGRVLQLDRSGAGGSEQEAAFDMLFRTLYAPLCAYADRVVRSNAVAEEIVDEVFLRIWRERENWPGFAGLRPYLYASVRNQALMHVRHEGVVRKVAGLLSRFGSTPAMAEAPMPADDELHLKQFAAAASAAVDRLPERTREVYVLYRQHELTYAEIGSALGLSVRSVENHLARAMKNLRNSLQPWLR